MTHFVKYYFLLDLIVTSNLAVPSGVTLTIEPGTILKFKDGTGFNCQGTKVYQRTEHAR